MIKENLNSLIMAGMKEHNSVKVETLRAIKTAIMNWETAKENVGKTYDEAVEINLLRKLVAQYEDTANMCNDGKHDELVAEAKQSAEIIKEFLPAPVTEKEIYEVLADLLYSGIEPEKKNMGLLIKNIKVRLPAADGKLVSQVVMKHLN